MHWQIIDRVAAGTFGTVYKVLHKETGDIAAMKLIHPSLNQEQERRRMKRGYIEASKISHPNCVKMIEWIKRDEEFGFIMEFVEGNHISILKGAPLSQIIQVLIQVCNGLDALHSRNVVHRDLKPSNILLTADQKVKITDFDLIKMKEGTMSLTATGTFMGTVKYSSPEQCSDASRIDLRSDLYSLGVIFYELVTKQLPFDGENFMAVALAHLRSPLISPKQLLPDLPDSASLIIQKLLEKNPKN